MVAAIEAAGARAGLAEALRAVGGAARCEEAPEPITCDELRESLETLDRLDARAQEIVRDEGYDGSVMVLEQGTMAESRRRAEETYGLGLLDVNDPEACLDGSQ